MTEAPFPILAADGSRLDWLSARYATKVTLRDRQADINHVLRDAPILEALIETGEAEWVTEFRCPRTLLSRQTRTNSPQQRMTWTQDEAVGETFLLPGLVAARELRLDTSDLNPFAWTAGSTVSVPAGWWLARGEAYRVTPLVASLVRFRRDNDGRLEPGQMSISEDSDASTPCFVVRLAADLYDHRYRDRDVWMAGLIAACARLPGSTMGPERDNWDHPMAQELRERLEDAGIETWDNLEGFDPARMATLLERFHVEFDEDDEE